MNNKVLYKNIFILLFCLFCPAFSFSITHITKQTDFADYSLLPACDYASMQKKILSSGFKVNTCFQDYTRIPKENLNGMESKDILYNLSLMAGAVRYYDKAKNRYVPIFKECEYLPQTGDLYIKDKNFGKIYCTSKSYISEKNCSINATLCKPLLNPLFREIKKGEFTIYVMTNDTEEALELYILIQSSYKIGFLFKSRIENAFKVRINGMQDWFVRMYTTESSE
mgnify:CR=1 FL=1